MQIIKQTKADAVLTAALRLHSNGQSMDAIHLLVTAFDLNAMTASRILTDDVHAYGVFEELYIESKPKDDER